MNGKAYPDEDLIGARYGALTITDVLHSNWRGKGAKRVRAKCDCGTHKQFPLHDVVSGLRTSCGCNTLVIPWDWKLALYTKWGSNAEAA